MSIINYFKHFFANNKEEIRYQEDLIKYNKEYEKLKHLNLDDSELKHRIIIYSSKYHNAASNSIGLYSLVLTVIIYEFQQSINRISTILSTLIFIIHLVYLIGVLLLFIWSYFTEKQNEFLFSIKTKIAEQILEERKLSERKNCVPIKKVYIIRKTTKN